MSIPLGSSERNVGQEHRDILDAALTRNADRAVALLARHRGATAEILVEADIEGYAARQRGGEPESERRSNRRRPGA
jgi:DNA-binding GntR family transcriptional regulator